MIDHLPDIVLIGVFQFLTTQENLLVASCVCRRWQILINSAQVWSNVDFRYERKLKREDLDKFIFPGTKKVLLDECHALEWEDINSTLKKCKSIKVLSCAFLTFCFTSRKTRLERPGLCNSLAKYSYC